jgi:hypothetical protein
MSLVQKTDETGNGAPKGRTLIMQRVTLNTPRLSVGMVHVNITVYIFSHLNLKM